MAFDSKISEKKIVLSYKSVIYVYEKKNPFVCQRVVVNPVLYCYSSIVFIFNGCIFILKKNIYNKIKWKKKL